MNRRRFLSTSLAALTCAAPAFAQDFADRIVSQLRSQGFSRIKVSRTLLGRTRIVATGQGGRREIILNPRTGEILRDLWQANAANASSSVALLDDGDDSNTRVSRNDNGDDDDGKDDDDKDDDDKDDDGGDDDDDEDKD